MGHSVTARGIFLCMPDLRTALFHLRLKSSLPAPFSLASHNLKISIYPITCAAFPVFCIVLIIQVPVLKIFIHERK